MPTPRIVFLGTPRAAAAVLEILLDGGVDVVHVISGVDKRRGRGSKVEPSPVKHLAESRGLAVSHDLSWCDSAEAAGSIGVVVAYGRIIPKRVLDAVPMVNVHFSLLPRWRGAAPVERAIMAGDRTTGVCLMQMEAGLDTGPVFSSAEVPIDGRVTAAELTATLARKGGELVLSHLRHGGAVAAPQVGEATYAHKISPADLVIDWHRGADVISRQVRAVRSHTWINGKRLRIVEVWTSGESVPPGIPAGTVDERGRVATGDGWLHLSLVQPEGRPVLDAADWLRGLRIDRVIFDR